MDRRLVRERLEWEALDRLAQQHEIRQPLARNETRGASERVGGGVDADRQGVRPGARDRERVAPVSRADIDRRARERAGERDQLTDVDVEKPLTDELTHA